VEDPRISMRDIRGNGLSRATRAPKVIIAIVGLAPLAVSTENPADHTEGEESWPRESRRDTVPEQPSSTTTT